MAEDESKSQMDEALTKMRDGKIPPATFCNKTNWKDYLYKYYYPQIQGASFTNSEHIAKVLVIDYAILLKYSVYMAQELVDKPRVSLQWAARAFDELDPNDYKGTRPEYLVRVSNISYKTRIRDIRTRHVEKLVSIDCIMRKVSDVYPKLITGAFQCARCGSVVYLDQYKGEGKLLVPGYCECNGDKKAAFEILHKESTFVDYQRMKLQESPEDLKGGEQPQDIDLEAMHELTGLATPGDRVNIIAIVSIKSMRTRDGVLATFEPYLECLNIEYKDETFEEVELTQADIAEIKALGQRPLAELRKMLIGSVAPTIYGYDEVKEAGLMSLSSGVAKEMPDKTRIRGDIHLLFVGDPGIAKSQILRYLVNLAPRGVYASGKSASAAGLTAAATKDDFDGQWTLEAGAMVIADKGICAVDEMDKMRVEDRASMHEGMEAQELHVAKAGILATLKCRCAVVGAANPKLGRFDPYGSLAEQINMPPSLLSRFDLIFVLQDRPDETRDTLISKHILKSHQTGEKLAHTRVLKDQRFSEEDMAKSMLHVAPTLDPKLLRKYIAYIRGHIYPVMTDEAKDAVEKFYITLRKDCKDGIPITARQIEGIIRISEAHAKLRQSEEVTKVDVDEAIKLIKYSLNQTSVDKDTGKLDIDCLMVGVGKAQRDRIKDLKGIIKELQDASIEKQARLEDIVAKASEHGMSKDKVEKELKKLREIGEVVERHIGKYRVT